MCICLASTRGHSAFFRVPHPPRGVLPVKRSITLLSALVAGGAVMGAGAAKAALVNDLVTFTGLGITSAFGQEVPTDPVFGSFTITFDPTLTHVDQTIGITLKSLNITVDS